MAVARTYRDLNVWKLSMDLAECCYSITQNFPKDELYGMTSQIRRASVSVPANIAEGYGRDSKGYFIQHLQIAQGFLKELETHFILVQRVKLACSDEVERLLMRADEVGRLLRGLIKSVKNREE
jgi:four helix bundle protein